MASEEVVTLEVIKKTQESLGKFVKKPALSEKLLKKPPFRFLHDIIKTVIKGTGYFEDLYTKAELDSENIKDRDAKMQFLQKLIDVLKIATNEDITARPSKIVAGQEPDNTNQLLQLIAFVISNKIDCKKAVETVKNGPQKQKGKVKEGSNKTVEKQTKIKNTHEKNKKAPDKSGLKDKIPTKISEKSKSEKTKKVSKTSDREKIKKEVKKSTTDDLEKPIENVEPVEKPKISPQNKKQNEDRNSDINVVHNSPPIQENNELSVVEIKQEIIQSEPEQERKNSVPSVIVDISEHEKPPEGKRRKSSASINSSSENVQQNKDIQVPKQNPRTASLNLTQSEVIKSIPISPATISESNQPSEIKRETTFVQENSNAIPGRPRTSLRPPSVRPASARPGAPRRRDKNVEIILQSNESVKMAGISVKIESFNSELEDDGENLVIIENSAIRDVDINETDVVNLTEQQGHLVQQILETQKELVQAEEKNLDPEYDMSILQKRQSSAKQMDSLRDIIQNLTRSINPLGKLMDFIPEDIDSMQQELSMWRDAYSEAASALRKEKSYTESALEPMKNQLAQINAAIREQIEMVDASRAKILQNSDKIIKLLTE